MARYLIFNPASGFPYDYKERVPHFKATRSLTIRTMNTGKTRRFLIMERDDMLYIKIPENSGCLGNLLQWLEAEYHHGQS